MRGAVLILLFQAVAHCAPQGLVDDDLPRSIGIVGVGTIGSSVAYGLLGAPAGHLPHVPSFVLSPRDAQKAAALKKAFPDSVRIATSNQEVLDGVDCVVLALPGSVAAEVIKSLKFRKGLRVISLIAAVNYTELGNLVGPDADITLALPLPAIAQRQGATLGFPYKAYSQAVFSAMGTYVAAADEKQFKAMGVAGALMGDFYMRQLTLQQWMLAHDVNVTDASAYIGAIFATIAADTAVAGPTTFADKVASQTPHGTNEMVWKQQQDAGVYAAVNRSLDAVYHGDTRAQDRTGDWQIV
eukprot:TRINITY_DN113787_c0_g1_i1.p1 TRINITY_DN113787_c0_g1~~TRINITY_DN113787_c0_g1_i1.p1  ORF type:complete len:298 (-),score=40.55 TRINITY_DN113787_c0_g1_i1:387-1280(-)